MFKSTPVAAALAAVACSLPVQAAISIDSTAFGYAQSFDTLATSGSSNPWTNDATLPGWSLFDAAGNALASYAADDGGSNAGAFKSFGSTGSSDRALGGLGSGGSYFGGPSSGSLAGWIALAFSNDTGVALAGFALGFDGEQWRNGNASAQPMVLSYGIGASFGAVTDWTTPGGGFDWSAPVFGGSSGAVDGNGAGLVTDVGGSVDLDWAAGQTLWIRWAEVNDAGSDHALALDNLSFSVTPVPEPGTYALMVAGLLAIGGFQRGRRR